MFIYVATNTVNGKMYVGQTILSVRKRWRDHLLDAKWGARHPLACAIRKYGKDAFNVVSAALSDNCGQYILDGVEKGVIAHLKTMVPTGYNIKVGGNGGPIHPETRAKISAALRGHKMQPHVMEALRLANKCRKHPPLTAAHRAKIVAAKAGIPVPVEVRARIAATLTGRKMSDECKAKIGAANKGLHRKHMSAEARVGLSAQRTGRKHKAHSAETKAKMSAARRAYAAAMREGEIEDVAR